MDTNIIIFYIIRLCVFIIAIWFGYLFVDSLIKPTILYNKCLTDTNSCTELEIYQYQNNFIAKEKVSQIYFWFNGEKLFVYGQNQDQSCTDNYTSVNVFVLNIKDNKINFTAYPNECVEQVDDIISFYENNYNFTSKIYYTRKNKDVLVNDIFSIIQQMYNDNIFTI
jgi:hypothetical protein